MNFRDMSRINSIVERALWLGVIGLAIFFWRHGSAFLDATSALSAGESLAALRGSESSLGAQWGAWLFRLLGSTPDVARAIGGIPALCTFFVVTAWVWMRWGWLSALSAGLLALVAPAWVNYFHSASRMSLFSLAVSLAAVTSFELHWRVRTGLYRPLLWLLLAAALFAASAAIGISGAVIWIGACCSLLLAFLFSERAFWKIFLSSFLTWVLIAASLAPFALSGWQMVQEQGWATASVTLFQNFVGTHSDWVADGSAIQVTWNVAPILKAWLKESFAWIWIPGLIWVLSLVLPRKINKTGLSNWGINTLAFLGALSIAAGFLPLSEGRELLRAGTPLLWPLCGAGIAWLVQRRWSSWSVIRERQLRWGGALVLLAGVGISTRFPPQDSYPSTAFAHVATRVVHLPEECTLWVAPGAMADSDLKGFAAWYFMGRSYEVAPRELPSRIAVPAGKAYWDPGQDLLWGQGQCEP